MKSRGVTRPMALLHEHGDGQRQDHGQHASADDRESGEAKQHESSGHHHHHHQSHDMSDDARLSMLKTHHGHTLWIYWALPLLGVWLLVSPFSFGHLNEALWVNPSGGRGPWFADAPSNELSQLRAWLMTASDVVSGILLVVFGSRTLKANRPISLWVCCFVGIWLTFAPVLFWAPTAASYVNDSFVGMLVLSLTVLVPGMPNMVMFMQHGPATPPGWTYNPSSWPQRWSMIVLGFVGFLVSRYLAMYQLGYAEKLWDPFFGWETGTKRVLDSSMSHALPISDAGLGTISYTFEFLMGYMGSKARFRTMPWMVAFFGILVIPLGLTHIFLVIAQPVLVHAWCTFCLIAAAIMLPMIPLEVDEVIAMLQHVKQAKKRGDRNGSLWEIFWKGGKADGCSEDRRTPELSELPDHPGKVIASSLWGMSAPPQLLVSTALGLALMACPTWFGVPIESRAADLGHLGGALITTVSVISMGEVVRSGRFVNVILGLGIATLAWFTVAPAAYLLTCTVVGSAVVAAAFPKGKLKERYGAWDRCIR